jgi:hypothetical protein
VGDLMRLGPSGSSMAMTPDAEDTQHKVGQRFLREKAGISRYVGGGQNGPEVGQGGYPLNSGSAWAAGRGSETPVGHTLTAQVVQAPAPPPFSAGGRMSAGPVPAVYAGNPDLTSYPG